MPKLTIQGAVLCLCMVPACDVPTILDVLLPQSSQAIASSNALPAVAVLHIHIYVFSVILFYHCNTLVHVLLHPPILSGKQLYTKIVFNGPPLPRSTSGFHAAPG